jgi:hypothetical protein
MDDTDALKTGPVQSIIVRFAGDRQAPVPAAPRA